MTFDGLSAARSPVRSARGGQARRAGTPAHTAPSAEAQAGSPPLAERARRRPDAGDQRSGLPQHRARLPRRCRSARPPRRRARTATLLTPSSVASSRVVHRSCPSSGRCSVRTTTADAFRVSGRPGRGASRSPSTPRTRKRSSHIATVLWEKPRTRATSAADIPPRHMMTISARRATTELNAGSDAQVRRATTSGETTLLQRPSSTGGVIGLPNATRTAGRPARSSPTSVDSRARGWHRGRQRFGVSPTGSPRPAPSVDRSRRFNTGADDRSRTATMTPTGNVGPPAREPAM